MTNIKSPLRYPGGKSRAIRFLSQYIPTDFKEYREPFVGGASVLLWALQQKPKAEYFASDANPDLIAFWKMLQLNDTMLSRHIRKEKKRSDDGRKLYVEIVARRDRLDNAFIRAMDFFILNRITFSGTIDSGGYSEQAFKSRFTQSSIDRLEPVANLIRGVRFVCDDYRPALMNDPDKKGVFLFLDPPYYTAIKSGLYGTNGSLHKNFSHSQLADDLKETPHRFMMTVDDCEHTRKLYGDFCVVEWSLQYGMNNVKRHTAPKGNELLVANFEIKQK